MGWEDSKSNNFKQDYFYFDFCFFAIILHLFLQIFQFFHFIFSSLVSVHIMVYKFTSVSNFWGKENRNRSRSNLV